MNTNLSCQLCSYPIIAEDACEYEIGEVHQKNAILHKIIFLFNVYGVFAVIDSEPAVKH